MKVRSHFSVPLCTQRVIDAQCHEYAPASAKHLNEALQIAHTCPVDSLDGDG